jgi:hypothetical protein
MGGDLMPSYPQFSRQHECWKIGVGSRNARHYRRIDDEQSFNSMNRAISWADASSFLVSAFLTPSVELTAGSAIGLSPVEPSKVRFFDTQNGLALRGRATSKART